MKTRIVFLDEGTMFNIHNISILNQLGEVVLYSHTNSNEVIERLKNAEIAITNKVVIDANIMQNCPSLKLICVAATGTNNIDKEFAAKQGILVKNATGYSTQSVAQVTFTMILQLIQNTNYYDNYIKSGEYTKNVFFTHIGKPFFELYGKRLGIIGLGAIGKQVAKIAEAFGMEVVYSSVSGNDRKEKYEHHSLVELLSTSYIVSIHSPLTDKTKNLITIKELALMKKSAIMVNVARGGIVVENDLCEALNNNLIAAAAIDVFENEPIKAENPLFSVNDKSKILMFPHIAWASIEARAKLVEIIYENIAKYLGNKN